MQRTVDGATLHLEALVAQISELSRRDSEIRQLLFEAHQRLEYHRAESLSLSQENEQLRQTANVAQAAADERLIVIEELQQALAATRLAAEERLIIIEKLEQARCMAQSAADERLVVLEELQVALNARTAWGEEIAAALAERNSVIDRLQAEIHAIQSGHVSEPFVHVTEPGTPE
jgi:hypothetical protein